MAPGLGRGSFQVRTRVSFRAVNRAGRPGYDPGLQRHHLLPCQLLGARCFGRFFDAIGVERVGFSDFRRNGLLLPENDVTAVRMGLPMHRGPHCDYNAMVMERVATIENAWSRSAARSPEIALEQALFQLSLLQKALRRRLLDPLARRLSLNRHDPLGQGMDFTELDAMAEALWGATGD